MIQKQRCPSILTSARFRNHAAELRQQSPQWADRLLQARSERELLDVVRELCNLTHAVGADHEASPNRKGLSTEIRLFICNNLHKGLTLKVLSNFLGYSEKYCSDLFQSTMGESFSQYLKHRRLEKASSLLATTEKGMGEIAAALGFSDQFAFSRFFKRVTGQSPVQFRTDRGDRRHRFADLLPEGNR